MKSDNPLNSIFIKNSAGKLSDEINDIKNISYLFKFLKDEKINVDTKIKVIDELMKINQYIFIYSIYILKKVQQKN